MENYLELLILLFFAYLFGWFVSAVAIFLSHPKLNFYLSIAHGYAILILFTFGHLIGDSDFLSMSMFLSCFNFSAMLFFAYLYVRKELKLKSELINNHKK